MDELRLRAVRRFHRPAVVSRVLGRLLRRSALRDEGRFARDGSRAAAADASQLVPRPLPLRLPVVSLPAGPIAELLHMSQTHARVSARPPADETSTAKFADDVRYYLRQRPPQLPSRYLYDALGSALFEALCQLPRYGRTRAETALLTKYADDIFSTLSPLSR